MALVSGVTMKVLIDQYDMSAYFRSISPSSTRGMYDTTAFGSTSKTSVPGFVEGSIDIEGFFEDTATLSAPDNIFNAIEASTTVPLVSIAPAGLAVGKRVYLMQAHEATHSVKAVVDALVLNSASFKSNNGYDFGVSLHDSMFSEPEDNVAASVDNLVSSANGGVGFVHLLDIAGTLPTVTFKIQHSTNNSTWVDLITFTTQSVAGALRSTVTGTVNRYVRAVWTMGGSVDGAFFVVTFARR